MMVCNDLYMPDLTSTVLVKEFPKIMVYIDSVILV